MPSSWAFTIVCLLWGSSFLLMKKAALVLGPFGVAGWRVTLGGATLLLLWQLQRQKWPLFGALRLQTLGIVVIGYCWPYFIQPWLIQRHGGALMGILIGLVPLITILVSIPILKIKPTPKQLIGVVGGFGFLILLFKDALVGLNVPFTHLLLCASVPFCYAIANTWIRKSFHHMSPMAFTMVCMLATAAIMLPLSATETLKPGSWFTAVLSMLILGVICTGIATWMFYRIVQQSGPLVAGMVTYVIPVVAMAWGWLDSETITVTQLVSVAGILAMVALVQGPALKRTQESNQV